MGAKPLAQCTCGCEGERLLVQMCTKSVNEACAGTGPRGLHASSPVGFLSPSASTPTHRHPKKEAARLELQAPQQHPLSVYDPAQLLTGTCRIARLFPWLA